MPLSTYQSEILSKSSHNIDLLRQYEPSTEPIVNIRIDATAGSGKTTLLTEIFKTAYDKLIPLSQVTILSFVKLSVEDIRKKVKTAVRPEDRKDAERCVRTFNSLALELTESAYKRWNLYHPDRICSLKETRSPQKYSYLIKQMIVDKAWNPHLCDAVAIKSIVDKLREQVIVTPTIEDVKETTTRFSIRHNLARPEEWASLLAFVQAVIYEGIRRANPFYTDKPCADYIDHCLLPFLMARSTHSNKDVYIHFKEVLEEWKANNLLLGVDETQDINPLLSGMIEHLNGEQNFIVVVGDDQQNIYFWRGSKATGMQDLAKAIGASSFDLPISYRLPSNHVAMIKSIWPSKKILAFHEKAGDLIYLDTSESSQSGDPSYLKELDNYLGIADTTKLLLGRKNSSVLSLALKLVSRGHRVKVKDLVPKAKGFAKQVCGVYKSGQQIKYPEDPDMIFPMIEDWRKQTITYWQKQDALPSKFEEVNDWAEALVAICLGVGKDFEGTGAPQTWDELEDRIDQLNSRKKDAIRLSTIHSAKGAEAEIVVLVDADCCPLRWKNQSKTELDQEMNALFVALSRSKMSDNPESGKLIVLSDRQSKSPAGWMLDYLEHCTDLEF